MPRRVKKSWKTGLIDIGHDCYAYIQSGGLNVSNAGLVVGLDSCLVIDTLYIKPMTQAFQRSIRKVTKKPVGQIVCTHHHADHTLGLNWFPRDIPVIAHEEDSCLSHGGVMNEGLVSTELGLKGMPNAAEDVMVARDIILSETTGGHLHVAHVSTAHSVDLIRQAKAKGLRVTTEVTPHHFTLCDTEVRGYHPDSKMAPPLRTEADRLAILEGMQDGTIDCIATDHAPHSTADKDVEFELSNFGIVGLETAWGLTYRLVQEGVLDLLAALALLTSGPAGIFGLDAGSLAVGSRADLCLIDPRAKQEVQRHTLHSKSKNTPFLGWSLDTRIERTLFGGRTVFRWTEAGGETYPLSR